MYSLVCECTRDILYEPILSLSGAFGEDLVRKNGIDSSLYPIQNDH